MPRAKTPSPRRRPLPRSASPFAGVGVIFAVALAGAVAIACLTVRPISPAGGGGGGGGMTAAASHSAALTRELGQAYLIAARVNERLTAQDPAGARQELAALERQLQRARAGARLDEQREVLRLEDQALQLTARIDRHDPQTAQAARALMDAVQKAQQPPTTQPKPAATLKPAPATTAKPKTSTPARAAHLEPRKTPHPAARPKPRVTPRPSPGGGGGLTAVPRPAAPAVRWPVRPHPARVVAPSEARKSLVSARAHLWTAQRQLRARRWAAALAETKAMRQALKTGMVTGTPWQRQALAKLDAQANALQFQIAHGRATAPRTATQLAVAVTKARAAFWQAAITARPQRGPRPVAARPHPAAPPKGGGAGGTRTPAPALPSPVAIDQPADPTLDEGQPGRSNALPGPSSP